MKGLKKAISTRFPTMENLYSSIFLTAYLGLKGLKKVEKYHTGWLKSRTFKTVAYKRLFLFSEQEKWGF
jgi:hypothetical protein